jgi:hypothetical protein
MNRMDGSTACAISTPPVPFIVHIPFILSLARSDRGSGAPVGAPRRRYSSTIVVRHHRHRPGSFRRMK